jgi:hypothetical protein
MAELVPDREALAALVVASIRADYGVSVNA